ncbi:MAG TPA: phosphoenolpyruvate carboxylase [Thermoanaerobaculia bacterium]|jgi:phosphoenolpyruvate carboxylase
MPPSPDQPLRDDVHLLGDLLGQTLREQAGTDLFAMVERVRALAKSGRAGDAADFDRLTALLAELPTAEALPVARAFAHFLSLANVAEQHHRVRRRRDYQRDPGARPQPGSFDEVMGRLRQQGIAEEQLFESVASLRIELVLTAHPTEVVRRTLLQKYTRIGELLAHRDRRDLTIPEQRETIDDLRREITSAWETDEVRHTRPTPLDEVKGGLFIFEQTLWDALPRYLRALDEALRTHTGRALPLDAAPIRFGSWIGGDRDGNPNVTAAVTRDACLLARWVAADLYLREVDALRSELSMKSGSAELPQVDEPYRAILKEVRDRLRLTRDAIEQALGRAEPSSILNSQSSIPLQDLLDPLLRCHRSLHETGNGLIADGRLLDLIRRVHAFGLTLVRLDVRQDSARHTALLDAITRQLGLGSYAGWPEEQRQEFLLRELASRRPLIPRDLELDDDAREDLATFHAVATIPRDSLGAYVITMAGQPSDVLGVALLQKEALASEQSNVGQTLLSVRAPLRVVPLFETIDDLRRAGETMTQLLRLDAYRTIIDGRQEVMVGYSDSSKDSGRFTAAWELFQAQEQIVAACRDAGIELTLFHGRGGSVGRGGGPTYLAIASQPPGSVDGRLRVTVQGEMIQAEFGLVGIALRTLEVYTTATLDATLAPSAPPRDAWRTAMQRMSDASRRGYRELVYETPRFIDYFRTATPEVELGEINIGSRPARRGGAKKGVESLRAIPWQFAWTQNRLLLPSWLGVDNALEQCTADDDALLTEMMREWPFFRSTIELIEMVLAKAEARIAAYYDRLLVPAPLHDLGQTLRDRLLHTVEQVQRLTGHDRLLETNPALRRSIDVRNPYVDPINVVQAEILRRLRQSPDDTLRDAFITTVNGIAAGMRNTG